jgi:hypothetical protein
MRHWLPRVVLAMVRRRSKRSRRAVMLFGLAAILTAGIPLAQARVVNEPSAETDYGWIGRGYPQLTASASTTSDPSVVLALVLCVTQHPFEQWQWGALVRLHSNAFTINRKLSVSVDTAQPEKFWHYTGTVLITGRFTANRTFVGAAHIAGAPCHQSSYTATYDGINHLGPPWGHPL